MKTLEEIKNILIKNKKMLENKYHIKKIGVFGSYAKNNAVSSSDIDILVEYYETPDLIEFIDLKYFLTDLLDMKVDLVMKKALKPKIGENILKEVIYL